jgi:hypothetical protein
LDEGQGRDWDHLKSLDAPVENAHRAYALKISISANEHSMPARATWDTGNVGILLKPCADYYSAMTYLAVVLRCSRTVLRCMGHPWQGYRRRLHICRSLHMTTPRNAQPQQVGHILSYYCRGRVSQIYAHFFACTCTVAQQHF